MLGSSIGVDFRSGWSIYACVLYPCAYPYISIVVKVMEDEEMGIHVEWRKLNENIWHVKDIVCVYVCIRVQILLKWPEFILCLHFEILDWWFHRRTASGVCQGLSCVEFGCLNCLSVLMHLRDCMLWLALCYDLLRRCDCPGSWTWSGIVCLVLKSLFDNDLQIL